MKKSCFIGSEILCCFARHSADVAAHRTKRKYFVNPLSVAVQLGSAISGDGGNTPYESRNWLITSVGVPPPFFAGFGSLMIEGTKNGESPSNLEN